LPGTSISFSKKLAVTGLVAEQYIWVSRKDTPYRKLSVNETVVHYIILDVIIYFLYVLLFLLKILRNH
jgi:hypothetical protein